MCRKEASCWSLAVAGLFSTVIVEYELSGINGNMCWAEWSLGCIADNKSLNYRIVTLSMDITYYDPEYERSK